MRCVSDRLFLAAACSAAACLFGLVLSGSAAGAVPPQVGDAIALDHGYRYGYDAADAVTSSLAASDSSVLLAWGENGGRNIMARTFGLAGEEVGESTMVSLGPGYQFDLSEPDAAGWKLVATDGSTGMPPRRIFVCNLDPRSLAVTAEREMAASDGDYLSPEMARIGDVHAVLWIEAGWPADSLRLRRVDAKLDPLEPSAILVASGMARRCLDLAAGDGGGLIAYVDAREEVCVQRLGSDALPAGDPIPIGPFTDFVDMVAASSCGSGWLVTWSTMDGLSCAFLSEDGAIEPPGIFSLDCRAYAGLAVAGRSDGSGLLSWRQGYSGAEGIHAARLQRGTGVIGTPWVLHDDSPYQLLSALQDPRDLASLWTGSCYVVLWDSWYAAGGEHARDGVLMGKRAPAGRVAGRAWGQRGSAGERDIMGFFPTLADWIPPDGPDPGPRIVSRGTIPAEIAVQRIAGGYLAIVREREADEYLHTFRLDESGTPVAPAARWRSAVEPDSCDGIYSCFLRSIRQMVTRSWDDDVALGYSCLDAEWRGEIIRQDWRITVDRLHPDGSLASRLSFVPGQDGCRQLLEFDHAPRQDGVMAFCATRDTEMPPGPSIGWVQWIDPHGQTLRTWRVASTESVCHPALVPLAGEQSYFLVWTEGWRPMCGLLRLDSPDSTIVGMPFAMSLGEVRRPLRLAPGPGRVLCLLAVGPWEDSDLYGFWFDDEGMPLQQPPVPVCLLPGVQEQAEGIWDGRRYFAAWSTPGERWNPLAGGRFDLQGRLYDGVGFLIDAHALNGTCLATDGSGRILAGYTGHVVRLIEDPGPPSGVAGDGGTRPSAVRLVPNPSRGEVRLAAGQGRFSGTVRIFDAAGRLVASRRCAADPGRGELVWDGREASGSPAPAGIYYVILGTAPRAEPILVIR